MNIRENLEHFIRRTLSRTSAQERVAPSQLTIGLEHEFFLVDAKSKLPVTHEQSQDFLHLLSEQPNWTIRQREMYRDQNMISRVSQENGAGRFTAIKYDHHPHLLEVAFTYCNDLDTLRSHVRQVLDLLRETASRSALAIFNGANLHLESNHPSVVSDHPTFQSLRAYRKKLLLAGHRPLTHVNYASTIAATQTHIGGTLWWQSENLVSLLYSFEPQVLPYTTRLSIGPLPAKDFLEERWSGYKSVFAEFPLVGFPKMKRWTLSTWCDALMSTPLYGSTTDTWAGSNLNELKSFPFEDWPLFFYAVRDLQIIRPRLFGTLEFRGDPSQQTEESIMAVAALRLGLCAWALNKHIDVDLVSSHDQWWGYVKLGTETPDKTILEKARQGLLQRGLKEEKFLLPIESLSLPPRPLQAGFQP